MYKLRKYISIVLVVVISACMELGVYGAEIQQPKVYVDGKLSNIKAEMINGNLYLPVSSINERTGTKVTLSSDKKTVHITSKAESIQSIINKVSPSVVGIIGNSSAADSFSNSETKDGIIFGTGVIIRTNGYIITNAHVVGDLENIIVILSNGKAYQARLKAIDEKTDLALVKIDKGGLTPATLGEMSDIKVGEEIVAIGTPLSLTLRNSATKGIISGMNRSIQSDYRFIQSDAAINGGNSGGPIVNMQGKVIGINTVKYSGVGVEGLAFSIPIDTVKYAIDHFMKYGKIKRPYLGAKFIEGIAAKYGLPSSEGLTITEVEKYSPAEKAGLLEEDILTAVNNVSVSALVDFNEEMKKYLPGNSAVLTIKRDNKVKKIKVVFN